MDLSGSDKKIKAWRDIWSAGHGVGSVKSIESVSTIIDNLKLEYEVACK
jgi:nitronate monooxygenase